MRVLEQTYSKLSLSLVPNLFCRLQMPVQRKTAGRKSLNLLHYFLISVDVQREELCEVGRGGGQMEPEMGAFSAGYSLSGAVLQL